VSTLYLCQAEPLRALVERVVQAMGAEPDIAAEVARHLVRENLAAAKRVPAAEAVAEAPAPGEPEVRTGAPRERDGITLPEANLQDLAHVAARFDVALPECHRM
jgi:LDH2 family malate/lactate/ureidoglycolate dehydrogenase